MTCVCGHERRDHKPATMSVPLPALPGGAIYPINGNHRLYASAATCAGPGTYDTEECGCGCTEYLHCSLLNSSAAVDSGRVVPPTQGQDAQ